MAGTITDKLERERAKLVVALPGPGKEEYGTIVWLEGWSFGSNGVLPGQAWNRLYEVTVVFVVSSVPPTWPARRMSACPSLSTTVCSSGFSMPICKAGLECDLETDRAQSQGPGASKPSSNQWQWWSRRSLSDGCFVEVALSRVEAFPRGNNQPDGKTLARLFGPRREPST
ncbi:uncharacterized protein B0I36DRAFT_405749 [Microdochium trichocladiopsis]|uniref:Uncharacterized protein n=1 Tax=Microdochium trichocladiopsis TaxID=1682393 RepID=A0A9P9BT72_9PEZI|nr:uncharacterized protein B0I36DRAFT_405749 [Microdochium trichocladiopsis]KAH7035192.1 hypothetical protein B0I36DRAFT_405749 [Microdochium trichocladiopsis]